MAWVTSNLSKAYVTRDSIGFATWELKISMYTTCNEIIMRFKRF